MSEAELYARAVATIWRDSAMKRIEAGDSLWAMVSHPLALVLAALDGETDPLALGVSPDALTRTLVNLSVTETEVTAP